MKKKVAKIKKVSKSESLRLKSLFEKKKRKAFTFSLIAFILISLILLFVIIQISFSVTGNFVWEYSFEEGDDEIYSPESMTVEDRLNEASQTSQGIADSLPTYINPVFGFFRSIWNVIKPIWEAIFGPTEDEVATAKSMFVILSFWAVWYFSDKIPDIKKNLGMHIGITILLGILFSRWVAQDALVKTVLMPYTAVGAGLSALLPVLVAFYFLVIKMKGKGMTLIRVLGWVLIFVYLALAWYNAYQDPDVPREYLTIYPAAIGIMAILSIFSRYIRATLKLAVLADEEEFNKDIQVEDYKAQIVKIRKNIGEGITSAERGGEMINEIKNKIELLLKDKS